MDPNQATSFGRKANIPWEGMRAIVDGKGATATVVTLENDSFRNFLAIFCRRTNEFSWWDYLKWIFDQLKHYDYQTISNRNSAMKGFSGKRLHFMILEKEKFGSFQPCVRVLTVRNIRLVHGRRQSFIVFSTLKYKINRRWYGILGVCM